VFDISDISAADRTNPLLAALDIVGHLLTEPKVAAAYALQDDVGSLADVPRTLPGDVICHFRDHAPKILVGECEHYGATDTSRFPSILLNKNLVHSKCQESILFARFTFRLLVDLF
jgi:hypothetical protein